MSYVDIGCDSGHERQTSPTNAQDLVSASFLLRTAIQSTPHLSLIGDSYFNLIAFTLPDHSSLLAPLFYHLQHQGWNIVFLEQSQALQVCLTLPMTPRVKELIKAIREGFLMLKSNSNFSTTTPGLSPRNRWELQSFAGTSGVVVGMDSLVLKRFPHDTLLELFSNVCGR